MLAGAALATWAVVAAAADRGLPAAVILRGAVSGGLVGLGAAGVVLVYRAERVVNFAQAHLGLLGTVAAVVLRTRWSVPWAVAVAAGMLVAAAVGAASQLVVLRRLRVAPRLTATVATIGLAQLLGGAGLLAAAAAPDDVSSFRAPVDAGFSLSGQRFGSDTVVAVLVLVVGFGAMGVVLRRTSVGNAVTAAADDPDRARLAGIPVTGLTAAVWAAAAVLSALALVLRIPLTGATTTSVAVAGGTALLLRMLAAAVLGGMDDLGRTAVAAVVIGVVEEAARWITGRTTLVDAGLVIVVVGALLLQRDLAGRSTARAATALLAVREPRRPTLPASLGASAARTVTVGPVVAFTAAAALPLLLRPSQEQALAVVCVYALLAVSFLVLTGWAGHVSLGQLAFAAIGGATTSVLHARHGWELSLAVGAGIALAALAALLVGLPALRIGGPFLAVSTLSFGLAVGAVLVEQTTPWAVQRELVRPALWGRFPLEANWQVYELCLAALAGVLVLVGNLRRSRTGRALLAIRDNPTAAGAAGLDRVRLTLGAFVLSGAIAGFAGSLYVLVQRGFQPESYTPEASIGLLAMAVVGGLGSASGVVLGAVYVRGADLLLPGPWSLLATGFGIVALLLVAPEGIGGALARVRGRARAATAPRRSSGAVGTEHELASP